MLNSLFGFLTMETEKKKLIPVIFFSISTMYVCKKMQNGVGQTLHFTEIPFFLWHTLRFVFFDIEKKIQIEFWVYLGSIW